MSDESPEGTPSDRPTGDARGQWVTDRTTFQRVYDVMTGVSSDTTVSEVADRADCSADGARDALTQLVEMGVVEKRDGRPAAYRRNESYFRWKRIEELARNNAVSALRTRVDELLEEDDAFQDRFDVPDPDAVAPEAFEGADHDEVHDRWDALSRWRSVRRDIEVLQRAAHRAEQRKGNDTGDTVSA